MDDEPRAPEGGAPTPPTEPGRPTVATAAADPRARSFEEVLDAELDAVREGRRLRTGRLPEPFRGDSAVERAHDARLVGLSFSGGGIRSATFNLGVLQGLARLGLLRRFDYLSVNSGGGYIGGWLTAWIRRRGLARVESELAPDACRSEEEGSGKVAGAEGSAASRVDHETGPGESRGKVQEGQDVEAGTIRFLRMFSNYLTPRVGAFSADTWTVVTTYMRNLLLNLSVLVFALGALLLLPRLLLLASRRFDASNGRLLFELAFVSLLVCILGIGWNMVQILRRERRDLQPWPRLADQGWTQVLVVAPLFVSAWFTSLWFWHVKAGAEGTAGQGFSLAEWVSGHWGTYAHLGLGHRDHEAVAWVLVCAVVYTVPWLLGFAAYVVVALRRAGREQPPLGRLWRAILIGAPIAGGLGGLLLWSVTLASSAAQTYFLKFAYPPDWHLLHINVWKPPAVIVVFLLTAIAHTGLMGRAFPESLRQWWSRLGAWMLIYSITWVGLFGIAIYGPVLLILLPNLVAWAMAGGWLASTISGVLVGKSSKSPASSEEKPPLFRRIVIAVVPQLFVVGLLALVALGLHLTLSPSKAAIDDVAARAKTASAARVAAPAPATAAGGAAQAHWSTVREAVLREGARDWLGTTPGATWGLLALLSFIAVVLSWRIDINEFSMHLFYRDRLIRAYLGASNPSRRQQPFTGFDSSDDLPLATLSPFEKAPGSSGSEAGYDGPYPIHNITLNLVAGKELAWQERKASAFVATPLFTGFEVYGDKAAGNLSAQGFRPTGAPQQRDKPITLGTAMGISGAAVSPNMGAGTTPAMAFLLTVFNVRLGWWLGNPRHEKTWPKLGPTFGLMALLSELFGHTDETSRYVYLSDGGHFENLALYELIRRRCRFIVATDAGADPKLGFGDLGNLVRKCSSDFGIEVDVDTTRIHRDPQTGNSLWHCAVGTIRYDLVDPGAAPGTLVYIKSSLTGDEPADTASYATEHPEFPHQSTADQWFGESQFESYRKLGEHIVLSVLSSAVEDPGAADVERLFVDLREIWYPPATAETGSFSLHAHALSNLLERLCSEAELGFLSAQLYPEWRELTGDAADRPPVELWLPGSYAERRAGFFFCTSLIQLMELVYLDLHLESENDHPDNRGWMNLFHHWTWSGMFRVTWAVTASTYGARFQTFAERRLGLGPGYLVAEEIPLASDGALDDLATDPRLNFLELSLVRQLTEKNPGRVDRLFVLRLVVRDPTSVGQGDGGELRFTFGFAAAHGDALVFFRVQDHLRKMGLGRDGLDVLIRRQGLREVEELRPDQLPEWSLGKSGEHDVERFRRLFRSVLNEVQETPGLAAGDAALR